MAKPFSLNCCLGQAHSQLCSHDTQARRAAWGGFAETVTIIVVYSAVRNIPCSAIPDTMLAVRKLRHEPGLWLEKDTPVPQIGPREVLVQVTHAGICGTD